MWGGGSRLGIEYQGIHSANSHRCPRDVGDTDEIALLQLLRLCCAGVLVRHHRIMMLALIIASHVAGLAASHADGAVDLSCPPSPPASPPPAPPLDLTTGIANWQRDGSAAVTSSGGGWASVPHGSYPQQGLEPWTDCCYPRRGSNPRLPVAAATHTAARTLD